MEPMTIQELADATGATLLGEGIARTRPSLGWRPTAGPSTLGTSL